MPYTLVKALIWLVIAFVIGLVIGWLLRSAAAHRQLAKARTELAERDRLRQRIAELEPIVDERTRLVAELEACRSQRDRLAGKPPLSDEPEAAAPVAAPEPAEQPEQPEQPEPVADGPDLAAAAAALGRPVAADDLTVVEGIGPKIAELCDGIGISTWADLAATEASLLRTMLTDAGARYKVHDPTSWPEQAQLLAAGRWDEFKALVDRLDGGVDTT